MCIISSLFPIRNLRVVRLYIGREISGHLRGDILWKATSRRSYTVPNVGSTHAHHLRSERFSRFTSLFNHA